MCSTCSLRVHAVDSAIAYRPQYRQLLVSHHHLVFTVRFYAYNVLYYLQIVGKIGSFFAPGGSVGAQRKSSLESATLFAE
jgi:hypothetical protein